MTKIFETPQQFADEYLRVLTAEVGKDLAGCTNTERYQALAKLIAQKANQQFAQSDSENAKSDKKKVYYFSLEFLLGPLLDNYLLNYGIRDVVTEGLDSMGIKLDDVLAEEGDPGLGNGGLGRLAACFLDSMAAEGILGFGNGMRYRYGLFRQKIEGGRQVEVTDNWLDKGYPWETRHDESSVIVRFGGEVVRHEDESGKFWFSQEGGEMVKAVPYDVPIIGMDGKTVNRLRLWSAEPAQEDFDLDAFNRGDYAAAAKFRTDAEAISEILYPNDAGEHGRILRLKQEYLFVAAGLDEGREIERGLKRLLAVRVEAVALRAVRQSGLHHLSRDGKCSQAWHLYRHAAAGRAVHRYKGRRSCALSLRRQKACSDGYGRKFRRTGGQRGRTHRAASAAAGF